MKLVTSPQNSFSQEVPGSRRCCSGTPEEVFHQLRAVEEEIGSKFAKVPLEITILSEGGAPVRNVQYNCPLLWVIRDLNLTHMYSAG